MATMVPGVLLGRDAGLVTGQQPYTRGEVAQTLFLLPEV